VAVANAILFVTFAEMHRHEGADGMESAVFGARTRRRAILMTASAMIAGMVPMAIGFGQGGDQAAPLGRAVIGGLLAATTATVVLLPAVCALWMDGVGRSSVPLDPNDRASRHHISDHLREAVV